MTKNKNKKLFAATIFSLFLLAFSAIAVDSVNFQLNCPSSLLQGNTGECTLALASSPPQAIRGMSFTLSPTTNLQVNNVTFQSTFMDVSSSPTYGFSILSSSNYITTTNPFTTISVTVTGSGDGTLTVNPISVILADNSRATFNIPSATLSTCNNVCTPSGATQCSATGVRQLCADYTSPSDGCTEWGDAACDSGEICSVGSCIIPPPTCGDGSCNGDETGATCLRDCTIECQNVVCVPDVQVCEANLCKLIENQICMTDSDCASNLDCILVRGGEHKCKNLDNGVGLTNEDGSLGEIKNIIKSATSLSSTIPEIARKLRTVLSSTGALTTLSSCTTSPEESIKLKTDIYVCRNIDGNKELITPLASEGALGEIKKQLLSPEPLIKRLALIAKELNLLFT